MCKIITSAELANRSRGELSALFRKVSQELTQTAPDTAARRNRLASLENIRRAQARHDKPHFKPPGF